MLQFFAIRKKMNKTSVNILEHVEALKQAQRGNRLISVLDSHEPSIRVFLHGYVVDFLPAARIMSE